MSAANDRLPAGGFALRHGFPEWFDERSPSTDGPLVSGGRESPHIVEVLQYLRIVFETETVLDSVPLELAANAGAWHAWQSYRSKILDGGLSEGTRSQTDSLDRPIERSLSPGQQPGGARRPGEWNWQGVWEDRVQKSIQASSSEPVLYGGDGQDVINFLKMDQETFGKINLGEYTGM